MASSTRDDSFTMPDNQQGIKNLLALLGYEDKDSDYCRGIAHMGKQAILAGDYKNFRQRILIISHLYKELFTPSNDIERSMSEVELGKAKLQSYAQMSLVERHKLVQEKLNLIASANESKKIWVDILAFFDGIQAYQNADFYPDLFPPSKSAAAVNQILKVQKLISPIVLDDADIIILNDEIWLNNAYKEGELVVFFSELRSVLESFDVKEPFVLILRAANHAIAVSYDLKNDVWLLIDANNLKVGEIESINELANKLVPFLFGKGHSVFSTDIFVNNNTISGQAKEALITWAKRERQKNLDQKNIDETFIRIDKTNSSRLYIAAKSGDLETVKALANKDKGLVSFPGVGGQTPLFIATKEGHTDVVQFLLTKDANPNTKNKAGMSPLNLAVDKQQTEIVKLLLAAKADVNTSYEGITPICIAAQMGNPQIIKLLIDAGADVNTKIKFGTPFLLAVNHGHVEAVEQLIKAGVDVNDRTKNGRSALYVAVQQGSLEIILLLLNNHADPKLAANISTQDLLLLAKKNNTIENMNKLIKSKKEIEGNIEITPYDLALALGHMQIAEALNSLYFAKCLYLFNKLKNFPYEESGSTKLIKVEGKVYDKTAANVLSEIEGLLEGRKPPKTISEKDFEKLSKNISKKLTNYLQAKVSFTTFGFQPKKEETVAEGKSIYELFAEVSRILEIEKPKEEVKSKIEAKLGGGA